MDDTELDGPVFVPVPESTPESEPEPDYDVLDSVGAPAGDRWTERPGVHAASRPE
jgi:hypothetical protein